MGTVSHKCMVNSHCHKWARLSIVLIICREMFAFFMRVVKHRICFSQIYAEIPLSLVCVVLIIFREMLNPACLLSSIRPISHKSWPKSHFHQCLKLPIVFIICSETFEFCMLVVKHPTYFAQIYAENPFSPMFEIAHSFYHLQWNVFILHVCRQVSLLFAQIYIDFAFSLWFKIVRCCNHLTWNNCILHSISSIIGPAFRYV